MGPDDGYLLQYSKDVDSFWASARELQLGATFRPAPRSSGRRLERIVPEVRMRTNPQSDSFRHAGAH